MPPEEESLEQAVDRMLAMVAANEEFVKDHADPEMQRRFQEQAAETRAIMRWALQMVAINESAESGDLGPAFDWWTNLSDEERARITAAYNRKKKEEEEEG